MKKLFCYGKQDFCDRYAGTSGVDCEGCGHFDGSGAEEREVEMEFDKLVRDNIPQIIENSGKRAITRTLDDEEYKVYLEKKLDEEVAEFHESKSLEELADIAEVLNALRIAYGYSLNELDTERLTKTIERGAFTQKILLLKVEEGADDE